VAFGRPVPQGLPSTPCRQQNASPAKREAPEVTCIIQQGVRKHPGAVLLPSSGPGVIFIPSAALSPQEKKHSGGQRSGPAGEEGGPPRRPAAAQRSP